MINFDLLWRNVIEDAERRYNDIEFQLKKKWRPEDEKLLIRLIMTDRDILYTTFQHITVTSFNFEQHRNELELMEFLIGFIANYMCDDAEAAVRENQGRLQLHFAQSDDEVEIRFNSHARMHEILDHNEQAELDYYDAVKEIVGDDDPSVQDCTLHRFIDYRLSDDTKKS